jgi:hypothetical protein
VLTTDSGASVRRLGKPSAAGAVALVLALLGAFIMHRPDRELPFDNLDFSEFLPILQSSESFWERIPALMDYYARHGRANLLPYVLLSAKWEVFGWWSPGWQWSRYAVMVGVIVLAFLLLRRLGATILGSAAGASVFLVAPAAVRGWIRLTAAEPLGTLLLLALCLTILPARRLRESRTRWLAVALLAIGVLLTKEMLAAALVLPVGLLLLTDDDGRVRAPAMTRQVTQLVVLLSVIGVLCLGPMLRIALAAPEHGYSSLYGDAARPVPQAMRTWWHTFVPFDPAYGFPAGVITVALILLVGLLVCGWWLHLRTPEGRAHGWLLALAMVFPLVGAIVYAPWPAYQEFYAMPFLFGTSVLVAFAVAAFQRGSPRPVEMAALGWWGALLLVGGIDAHRQAASAAASQLAMYRLVTHIHGMAPVDSVLVATDVKAPQQWQGAAGTLRRYALAVNVPWPPTRDIPCSKESSPSAATSRIVVVYRYDLCSRPVSAEPIVQRFRRLSLRRLRLVDDSVRIDVEATLDQR